MNLSYETQQVYISGLIDAIYFVGYMMAINAAISFARLITEIERKRQA